jgi:hypothetical protein
VPATPTTRDPPSAPSTSIPENSVSKGGSALAVQEQEGPKDAANDGHGRGDDASGAGVQAIAGAEKHGEQEQQEAGGGAAGLGGGAGGLGGGEDDDMFQLDEVSSPM